MPIAAKAWIVRSLICVWLGLIAFSALFVFLTVASGTSQFHRLRTKSGSVSMQQQQTSLTGTSTISSLTMSASAAAMPPILYGTAWKKLQTQPLVELAIRSGFRGIDTACQPKHYFEAGVGAALEMLYREKVVTRKDIFLQTKFTSLHGQDRSNPIPYDATAPLEDQVFQSFEKSKENLRTEYVDSLVLHGPMPKFADTMRVWRSFEAIYKRGEALQIGLSNTYDLGTLSALYEQAEVKPTVLQNRFYQDTHYDQDIRRFCLEKGIQYQSFWTLTANPHILKT